MELVRNNCFGAQFYAQAFTKFALNKKGPDGPRHGLVLGYEVFSPG